MRPGFPRFRRPRTPLGELGRRRKKKLNVFVANEQSVVVDELRLVVLAQHALRTEDVGEEVELSVLLVSPDHMKRLNKRFAGDEHATDVLAFPMMEDEEEAELMLGDVVICPEVAAGNAEKLGHPLVEELDTLLVHGILHLLGYDHQGERDKEQMERKQREIVESFSPSGVT